MFYDNDSSKSVERRPNAFLPSTFGRNRSRYGRLTRLSLRYRLPLGVCAGVAPFNFPAMIPLWMFPLAVTTGNTYVLKPSERVPLTAMRGPASNF